MVEIDRMLHEARQLLVTDSDECIRVSKRIVKFSRATKYAKAEGYGLFFLSKSYFFQKKYDSVFASIRRLEDNAIVHENNELFCEAKLLKSFTFLRLNDKTSCFKEMKKADSVIKILPSNNIKNIYRGLWHENQALINYESLEPRETVLKDHKLAFQQFKKTSATTTNGFVMHDKSDLLYGSYTFLANEFIALSILDSADYYLDKAVAITTKYKNPRRDVIVSNNIAYSHYLKKEFEAARDQYKKSVELAEKTGITDMLIAAYDGISISYLALGDHENVAKYLTLHTKLSEKARNENKKAAISTLDDIISEKENLVAEKNDHLNKIQLVAAFLVFLAILAVLFIYKKFQKEKLTKIQFQKLLDEKMAHQPVKQHSKNSSALEKIVEMAINNDPAFYLRFQEAFPDFVKKLVEIAPKINASELKLAAYIKLDFSAKEIARHTNTSVRAVEAKKYRIRKKLNVPSEQDLNVWMSRV